MNFEEEILEAAETVVENGATSDDLLSAVRGLQLKADLLKMEENTFRVDYTREELIEICERAIVPVDRWYNRDSPSAQEKVYTAWGHLKAGIDFEILVGDRDGCSTNKNTIWVQFDNIPSFNSIEWGSEFSGDLDGFLAYLPTPSRLDENEGRDWY